MKKTGKRLALMLLVCFMTLSAMAQVTTSSISGRVTDDKGPLIGATIVLVHESSGTKYGAVTNKDGYYTIQGVRPGGPYKADVAYVGYTTSRFTGLTLHLGETLPLNVALQETTQNLNDVVIIAPKIIERQGANTDISTRQIESLPTISRSINDFTRLSPYANGSNFAGQDSRYNSITIDGSPFKNNFGVLSSNLPGGDAQPISLDAIEEISVNVAPYDIRQSGFTGASVNAVTRSGDNTFKGAVYSFIHPKTFTGGSVGSVSIPNAKTTNKETYGFRIGGPIIKDKLFFFANGEIEHSTFPSNAYNPSTDGNGNASTLTSRTKISDLQNMYNFLTSTTGTYNGTNYSKSWTYNPGNYQDFGSFSSDNYKLLGRLDWNINQQHKFTVRYNYVHSSNDVLTNATSSPSGLSKPSAGRSSINTVAYSNAFYKMNNTVSSITGELNSTFNSKFSNKLLASYTHLQDKRSSPSSVFPFVDIWNNVGGVNDDYMTFGYELFTYNNNVINNTLNITDNFSYNVGKHTLTAGISFDRMYFFNSYMREGTSYYRYASMDDFVNGKQPTAFGFTYGYNGNEAPGSELTFGLGAAYLQDEFKILPNLKLNYGIRFERPYYFNNMDDNANIDALNFNGYQFNSGSWPKAKVSVAPRIGFNWDVKNDKSLVIRGGTGIFSGLLPFVWFTNQPSNSGMLQSPEVALTNTQLNTTLKGAILKFEPNFQDLLKDYPQLFPNTPGVLPTGASIAEVSKNFKMPQVWRSNLAADIKLPMDAVLTLEGMYSKDINAVIQTNVNLPEAQSVFTGADQRARWTSNKIISSISSAMVLGNTNKGYSYSLSAQLKKNFDFGLSTMIAYTYSVAKDVSPNPGSTAASAWSSNVAVNNLNNPGLSYSGFNVPSRLVGSASYRFSYAKHFATTVSLFYQGTSQGRKSYTFSNDMNGDGNASDLLYIPTLEQLQSNFTFADAKNSSGAVTMTANDQRDAFWNYIQSNNYLRKHEGKYVDRYGYVLPWVHRFDLKILEDIYANFGTKHKYTLQLSLDILNVGNLLNSSWGTYKTMGAMSYDNIQLLKAASTASTTASPTYNLNATSISDFLTKTQLVNSPSTGSTWSALIGLRLIF
jgi:hypothetical protein